MRYAGYLRYGQMPFCHSSFQKEKERFCKLLNYEFYFISWSSKKRKWLGHHYSNLISFFDRYIGLWCQGKCGRVCYWTKERHLRGFQNFFIDQLEEYSLNRGLKECLKSVWDNLRVVFLFLFWLLPWCQLHHKGWLPLVVKRWFCW